MPRALVIEDNEQTAYLLDFLLERAGFDVHVIDNGRDAEAYLCSEEPIDVVIMNLILPHMDGFELLIQIRESPARRNVPVVILSDKALEADVVRAFELGADDYLTKPFRPSELIARLRRFNQGRAPGVAHA